MRDDKFVYKRLKKCRFLLSKSGCLFIHIVCRSHQLCWGLRSLVRMRSPVRIRVSAPSKSPSDIDAEGDFFVVLLSFEGFLLAGAALFVYLLLRCMRYAPQKPSQNGSRAAAIHPAMIPSRVPGTSLERILLSLLASAVSVPIPAHAAGDHPDGMVGYAEIIAAQIGGRTAVGGKINPVE